MYELADLDPAESQITGDVRMALMPVFEENGFAAGVDSATINGSMGFSVVGSPTPKTAWST